MTTVRSALYQVAFFANLTVFCVVFVPLFVLPRSAGIPVLRLWARTSEWLLATVCGLRFEIRGREHLPNGATLVASKHQSAWETLAFLHILPDPAIVLKKELTRLPFFGWYAVKFGNLALDRDGGGLALRRLLRSARAVVEQRRPIVIFPEGTRRAPGAPPDYLRGVVALYHDLKIPCVPVALNSGLYWPRASWRKRPGVITVEFLPAIEPGLPPRAFLPELQARIEPATARLVEEGAARQMEAA